MESSDYIYLEDKRTGEVLAVDTELYNECFPLSECYDDYGHPVDSEWAGDLVCNCIYYFDGSRFRTVILEIQGIGNEQSDYRMIEDKKEIKLYDEVVENREYIETKEGFDYFKSGAYSLSSSRFASAFESFRITR